MKNLIVIIGTVILGAYIFNMMVGDGDDTLKGVSQKAMRRTIALYSEEE